MRRLVPLAVVIFVLSPVLASNPGEPLDCSDWVFLEPGLGCVPVLPDCNTLPVGAEVCAKAETDFPLVEHDVLGNLLWFSSQTLPPDGLCDTLVRRVGSSIQVFGKPVSEIGRYVNFDHPPTRPEPAYFIPAGASVHLVRGALATSGDARRYLLHDGQRYGHILDPRTGWPVRGAPRSVTVAAPTCTEAGMAATLAMLRGRDAERFLEQEGIPHWVVREADGASSPASPHQRW